MKKETDIQKHDARTPASRGSHAEDQQLAVLAPRVDVHESDTELVVLADVPGVDEGSVDVRLERDVLTIEAYPRWAPVEGHEEVFSEFGPCRFRRSFTLSREVDGDRIDAKLRNGVLRVTLPKQEKRVHRIPVRSEA